MDKPSKHSRSLLKSPTLPQFTHFVDEIRKELIGARLQGVVTTSQEEIWLEFYAGQVCYLVFSLNKVNPQVLFTFTRDHLSKKSTPIGLFLNAHLVPKALTQVTQVADLGRVVLFEFGSSDRSLQFDCIPHKANLHAKSEGREIHFRKPQESKVFVSTTSETSSSDFLRQDCKLAGADKKSASLEDQERKSETTQGKQSPATVRPENLSLLQWSQLYFDPTDFTHDRKTRSSKEPTENSLEKWKKLLEKKRKTLSVLELELQEKEERILSLQDKVQQQAPAQQGEIYEEIKSLKQKLLRTQQRKTQVLDEVASLEQGGQGSSSLMASAPNLQKKVQSSTTEEFSQRPEGLEVPKDFANSSFRRTQIQGFWVFRGRNGEENLSLLRYCRSWDYWLHLRDEPGAYGVIRRNKNEEVSSQVLNLAAQWLVRESVRRKWVGEEKFPVVVCEVKFVRPIKGSAKGLVTYQKARHYLVSASSR